MTPGPPAVSIAALNDLTLVLAGLTAKHPSPSSSSSPVTLALPLFAWITLRGEHAGGAGRSWRDRTSAA
jgi:hypothetical protein